MKKRAQVTIYVIIGLAIVFAFGFLLYVRDLSIERLSIADVGSSVELASQKTALKEYITSCLELKTKEAIDLYGIDEDSVDLIGQYIEAELLNCIDFDIFKEQGYELYGEDGFVYVVLSKDTVLSGVYLPVIITKEGQSIEISEYSFDLKREKTIALNLDNQGKTQKELQFITQDNNAEIIIQEETKITDNDENPLDEISLKIVDKNINDLSNNIVVGELLYNALPEGAQFEPAIKLTINYNEEDLPVGFDEEKLSLAYYDKSRDVWVSIPSTVDTINNRVSADISHFTLYSVVFDCTQKLTYQVIVTDWLYREPCGEQCLGWETNDGGAIYSTPEMGVSVIRPEFNYNNKCYKKDWDEDDLNNDGIKDGTECSEGELDCEEEDATPPTYGYDSVEDVGGYGDFAFTFHTKGDSCVDKDFSLDVSIKAGCDDVCTWTLNPGDHEGKIIGGENVLHVEVENLYEACSGAKATITFYAATGTYPQCGEGLITQNCQCGSGGENILHSEDQTLYCCPDSKTAVEDPSYCEKITDSCTNPLTEGDNGCQCGSLTYRAEQGNGYCCDGHIQSEPCSRKCTGLCSPLPNQPGYVSPAGEFCCKNGCPGTKDSSGNCDAGWIGHLGRDACWTKWFFEQLFAGGLEGMIAAGTKQYPCQ